MSFQVMRKSFYFLSVVLVLFGYSLSGGANTFPFSQIETPLNGVASDEGIRFSCLPEQLKSIESGMNAYLASMEISPELVIKQLDHQNGIAIYTLNTPKEDTNTINFKDRLLYGIRDDFVRLPTLRGKQREMATVSKKEILLALMQHGRLTDFSGNACDVQALKEHVVLRQNIVSWAQNLHWVWPDGGPAKWNAQYWHRGTPKPGVPLHKALDDAFMNQSQYAIGCYTASKMVIIQGVIDYYLRVGRHPEQLRQIKLRLRSDGEPLVGIEPGRMWDFDPDFDQSLLSRPGKLLKIQYGVAPKNLVPGDWVHLQNTDKVSYRKVGYEGANPIYLGRNRFADYFDDHAHSYTYEQKLDEVYQWRNGVFSRSRHAAKIKPLTSQEMDRLSLPPSSGGILADMRVFPYFFGYEKLPDLRTP